MDSHIYRSIKEPLREAPSWDERWRGSDKGLITAWEVGRRLAESVPELSIRAKNGELPATGYKGGVERKLKSKEIKYGPLVYLAELQGLRSEDLDIDLEKEVDIVCSRTNQRVILTPDIKKYSDSGISNNQQEFIALDVETANAETWHLFVRLALPNILMAN